MSESSRSDTARTGRPCAKPRCNAAARYAYTFDYDAMAVWLDPIAAVGDLPGTYALCPAHAERFSVPIGWQLIDRRGSRRDEIDGDVEVEVADGRPKHDVEHPAVRARKLSGIEIRPQRRVEIDDEEHPSGPLRIDRPSETPEFARQLEALAHQLAEIGTDEIDLTDVRYAYDEEATFGDEIDESEELFLAALAEAAAPWADDDNSQVRPA